MLYRIAVECWLYNLATLAIYHPFPTDLMDLIEWKFLDETFGAPLHSQQLAVHTSPFIGGSHVLYKLMLEVITYAREDAPHLDRVLKTAQWSEQLNTMSYSIGTYFKVLSAEVAYLYYWKFLLHIYALRIVLIKIADHEALSSCPQICRIIADARSVFEQKTTLEARNPALAWPLVIFLCASHQSSDLDFFTSTITAIRDNFDPGHYKRLTLVLNILKRKPVLEVNDNLADSLPRNDTIDLLLAKDGILGTGERLGGGSQGGSP